MTGTATQSDLMQLRGEVAVAQQTAQRARTDAETAALRAVDARLRAQGADGERDVTTLNRRLDSLATSLTELNSRLDELSARVDALGRQVRASPNPPSPSTPSPSTQGGASGAGSTSPAAGTSATTSVAGSTGGTATPSTPPRTTTGTPATSPPPTGQRPATTSALQPQDIYQAAYIDFSKGSYPLAIAGFREFLRRYPDHPLAGAAQYWIGEAHFSLARGYTNAGQADKATEALEQAVQEFRKVQANYARSDKAATALYKEALALLDLKQPAVAQARLQYLVDNFPQAEEAPLARERLAALKPADR